MDRSEKPKIIANYFPVVSKAPFFKYKVTVVPEIPNTQLKLYYKILSLLKIPISQHLNPYQPIHSVIYSPTQSEGFTLQVDYENIQYTVTIQSPSLLELTRDQRESKAFVGRFMNILQRNMKLQRVGRKYFNSSESISFGNYKLAAWPGYQSSLKTLKNGFNLNVDLCFKVIREESVYDYLQTLMQRFKGNQDRVRDELVGCTVMTK